MKKDKPAIAAYIRTSTLEGKSTRDMQYDAILAYINKYLPGGECTIYCDDGFSGDDDGRPEYHKFLSDIRLGKYTDAVVSNLDRFSRKDFDLIALDSMLKQVGTELHVLVKEK